MKDAKSVDLATRMYRLIQISKPIDAGRLGFLVDVLRRIAVGPQLPLRNFALKLGEGIQDPCGSRLIQT
jgi:hypothetical protein